MSESAFNEFLNDVQGFITKTPELSILIKKRYKECTQSYRTSSKFQDLLHITRAKIDSDNSRVFVHLRDFLNELKTNKAEKKVNKKRKRRESGSDISEAPSPKSLRDNSTDQDTDYSETENNSLSCEALHKIPRNPNNRLSLKHQSHRSKTVFDKPSDEEKDVLKHPDKTLEAVIENDVVQRSDKTVEAVIENDVVQHSDKTVEVVIEKDLLQRSDKTEEAVIENDVVQQSDKTVEVVIEKDVLQHSDKTDETVIETDGTGNVESTIESTSIENGDCGSSDQEGVTSQELPDMTSVRVSLTLDGDGVSPTLERQGVSPTLERHGDGVSPTLERHGVSPTLKRDGVSPTLERHGVSPTLKRDGVSPTLERHGVSPTLERHGVSPTLERHGVSPTLERHGVSPTLERDGVSPTLERDGVSPTMERHGVSPTLERHGHGVSPTLERDGVSPTLESDGELCMTVEDVGYLGTPDRMEDVDKSKGSSDINGRLVSSPKLSVAILENDCITIDDDDEEDIVLNKPDETKLHKENIPIVSPKKLKLEDSKKDNNENENSFKLKKIEKETCAATESKEEICEELTNKNVYETSESVCEDMAKRKNRVETNQIENQGTECTKTSKKFSEAEQEDNEKEEETVRNESDTGTQSESALPVTQEASTAEVPVPKGSQRQIRRLEKLLEDIRNKIEELKNADLSLDALGEEDSAYIQEDRYQHKFVKVWRKLCELKGSESTTGRPVERRFFYKGTRYPEVNRKLEKFVNKHKIFPDFHDVQKVIRDTSKQKKLGLSGPAVDRLAREAFQDIGDLLQKRRISDLRKTSLGHLPDEQGLREDPALKDHDLKKKLDENRKVGKGKLDDVLEKFCKWQEEAPEDKGDADKKSEDEEEEEDKEEMESTEKDDVPEMIEILNDDAEDDEDEASPVKAAADGSSSSMSFLSDDFSPKTSRLSPHLSSVQRRLGKDRMAASPLSSPCSPHVSGKDSPCISPKLPSSSSSPDSSLKHVSPYVVNSPPGSPTGSDISSHQPSSNLPKKSGPLVSIDDYMDCMPVLPKMQFFSNLSNSGTSDISLSDSDHCTLQISNVQSIVDDGGEDRQANSPVNKHGARRHLNWPIQNGTSKNTVHKKDPPSYLSESDGNNGWEEDSSNPPSPYPVHHSIMFRNSSKTVSLKPLSVSTTVIDLADEDSLDTLSSLPQDTVQQVASSSDEDVIIVLSDSD